jgi:hypothetical protein
VGYYPIRVDNCCTRTISFNIKDFDPQTLEPVTNRTVSGFVNGPTIPIEQKGTIRWKMLDNLGINRELTIPNSFYVPGGTSRLLSPQYWAQEAKDIYPINHDTCCITNSQAFWNGHNDNLSRPYTLTQKAIMLVPCGQLQVQC